MPKDVGKKRLLEMSLIGSYVSVGLNVRLGGWVLIAWTGEWGSYGKPPPCTVPRGGTLH